MLGPKFHAIASLPQHRKTFPKVLTYGTAGFRDNADNLPLDSVMFRVGCLAGIRARERGLACGVMITASHNEEHDNGAKIIDPDGSMLCESWENEAEAVINSSSVEELSSFLSSRIKPHSVASGLVFVACDTRRSSQRLLGCVVRGIQAVDCLAENCGLLTTPALHHIVRHSNGFGSFPTPASVEGYIDTICQGLLEISSSRLHQLPKLHVDCAGGVGAILLEKIIDRMGLKNLEIFNRPGTVELNEKCGAEFVQKQRRLPVGAPQGPAFGASLDGDGDRIVFWLISSDGKWDLLDGDKIAALLGIFLIRKFSKSKLANDFVCVQTAYANGASSDFLEISNVSRKIAKTGVKFVEAVAKEHKIGMYFEANGHGTILFNSEILKSLPGNFPEILGLAKLLNQAVGDALSDLLAVLAVLQNLEISPQEWAALYTDYPSRQTKIKVPDRRAVKCSADETRVIEPADLQHAIDEIVKEVGGRAFVRPSGTEDVLRIYAEAKTQQEADELAEKVAAAAAKILM